jgi:ribosomal protein RSM22 (predicted rRNA methylase)
MELPQTLREGIEKLADNAEYEQIAKSAQNISLRYREKSGTNKSLLTKDIESLAYATARMPATYASVFSSLGQVLNIIENNPKTLLDVGAGTGAASWAADSLLNLDSIVCVEREESMIKVGKELMKKGSNALQNAIWKNEDITSDLINEKADLVVASYVLNEMNDKSRIAAVKKLWDFSKEILLIIEPGTPVGFSNIITIRNILLELGAHIIAPCAHENKCNNEWCHFSSRVPRSRIHRELKGGEAPFEDEKYMYIAVSRKNIKINLNRVIRHPQIRSGHNILDLCTNEGIKNITFSKKDGEIYKNVKKLGWGDSLNIGNN